MPPSPSMRRADWATLLALSALWGGSFFFSKIALGELPPLTVALMRITLAALALLLFLLVTRQVLPRGRAAWTALFGMGFLNNIVPFNLILWGQAHMDHAIATALAAILNATTPLFGVVVAHGLTADEKASPAKILGVALGLTGVVVMIGPGALADLGASLPGELACLCAALSYAFAGVYGRRFRRLGLAPAATAFGQLAASSLMMIPLVMLGENIFEQSLPSLQTIGALCGLALLSTALAYILYFRLLAAVGATNLLLVTFLIPVSAILLGGLFLGERLSMLHFAGMGLIGLGLAAIDGRLLRRLHRQRAGDALS